MTTIDEMIDAIQHAGRLLREFRTNRAAPNAADDVRILKAICIDFLSMQRTRQMERTQARREAFARERAVAKLTREQTERTVAILGMRKQGKTYKEIGREFGISGCRVGQIVTREELRARRRAASA